MARGVTDALCAAVALRDAETGAHLRRIRAVTGLLLETAGELYPALALPAGQRRQISRAAGLHDTGKLAIPDAILKKPGPLTPAERAVMCRHPALGDRLLSSLTGLRGTEDFVYCRDICRWHHERWDGGGYPDGLTGEQTPLWARAAALADVYEALVSPRVYHAARPSAAVVALILSGACGAFDPRLLEALRRCEPRLAALCAGA